MRILLTNTGPWGTGSGTVADAVMQELARRGHEVMAFFPDAGLPGVDNDKYYLHPKRYRIAAFPTTYAGVELYTFPLIIPDPNPRNYHDAWTFKKLSRAQLRAYFGYMKQELQQLLNEFRPDIVECQHIWALDRVVHELGYPYIAVAHHSDQLGFLYDERMRGLILESAGNAGFIFAISDYVKQEVLRLYGLTPERVVTIPNGYNQQLFQPVRLNRRQVLERLGLAHLDALPLITFCGKVSKTKGIDVLLQANRIIQQHHPSALLILGSGDLTQICQGISGPYSLENVIYLGHCPQEELALLHNLATLSVLPSRTEGFGIAALEAMGCGKPIVATRVGGLADFAVGGLVEPEDALGLAEHILRVLRLNDRDYNSLCAEALSVAHRYSWRMLVERRLSYYETLIEKNKKKIGRNRFRNS